MNYILGHCFFIFCITVFFSQQVRVGGRNKNKIHSDHFPIELKSRKHKIMISLILIQFENGSNEFFYQLKWQCLTRCDTGGNLINMAAVEKTKRKNIIELQYCTGMSRRKKKKKKMKKISSFFFQFSNQRTNGPVNAHLISSSSSTKHTKPGKYMVEK